MDMYMESPAGITTKYINSKDYVLKLLANIYGQQEAGGVWNQYLVDKLLLVGFEQSKIDECIFYCNCVIFIAYVDDGLYLGNYDWQFTDIIKELVDLGYNIEDQGHPANYVGVNICKTKEGYYEFTQCSLIESIISGIGLESANIMKKTVPSKVSVPLYAFSSSPEFSWD